MLSRFPDERSLVPGTPWCVWKSSRDPGINIHRSGINWEIRLIDGRDTPSASKACSLQRELDLHIREVEPSFETEFGERVT